MELDDATLRLLDDQFGLVTRRQLRASGFATTHVDRLLRRGQLERVHQGVYRRTGAARSPGQAAMAAVLRCRHPSRIAGAFVLALLGCEGYEVETAGLTLLVPPGRRLAGVPFAWRPDPAPRFHHATVAGLPAVTPARVILELALDVPRDRDLLLAADRLRWRTRTGAAALRRVAQTVPDHPGVDRVRTLGLLDHHRPETPGERDLAEVLADLDPALEWQVWIGPDLRVDALWRDCLVIVEFDGWTHEGDRDRARDRARDARLEALGYLVVHVTRADLRHPESLRQRLRHIRAQRLTELRAS